MIEAKSRPQPLPLLPTLSRRQGLQALAAAGLAGWGLSVQAQPGPAAVDLERGLAGHWRGVLQYRDYQSDRLLDLPMRSQIQVGPDQVTITRLSTFDDGPVTGWVYITTTSLFDAPAAGKVSSAMFRKGRAVQTWTEDTQVQQHQDAEHWTVVSLQVGQDNRQPAVIRTTQTRDGATLSTRKEVKPPDAPDSAYVLRNETRLTREP